MNLYCPMCRSKLQNIGKCTFCGAEIQETKDGESLIITITPIESTIPEYAARIKAKI